MNQELRQQRKPLNFASLIVCKLKQAFKNLLDSLLCHKHNTEEQICANKSHTHENEGRTKISVIDENDAYM